MRRFNSVHANACAMLSNLLAMALLMLISFVSCVWPSTRPLMPD